MVTRMYLLLCLLITVVNCDNSFIFYEKLKLGDEAEISPGGLIKNANETSWGMGSVFYSLPLSFKNSSNEVACGRRPIQSRSPPEEVILVDWVVECWRSGEILKTADPKLNNDFEVEEMELVLKVGLLCSHPLPAIRPSISQVLMYLTSHASMPENLDALLSTLESWKGLNDTMLNHCVSETKNSRPLLTITELFTGR
ncbi:unnamed protein product [Ilex paraguariensis]|uniref:Uncharacterized protein n=1 Tax=Ilex paraguariensis TaxID=185542 RepID=A0ABC8UWC4_9AQUA